MIRKLFRNRKNLLSFFKKSKRNTEINKFTNHASKFSISTFEEDFMVSIKDIPYNCSANLESNCIHTSCRNVKNFNVKTQSDEFICLLINGINFFINGKNNIIYKKSNEHLYNMTIMDYHQFYTHVLHMLFLNYEI